MKEMEEGFGFGTRSHLFSKQAVSYAEQEWGSVLMTIPSYRVCETPFYDTRRLNEDGALSEAVLVMSEYFLRLEFGQRGPLLLMTHSPVLAHELNKSPPSTATRNRTGGALDVEQCPVTKDTFLASSVGPYGGDPISREMFDYMSSHVDLINVCWPRARWYPNRSLYALAWDTWAIQRSLWS